MGLYTYHKNIVTFQILIQEEVLLVLLQSITATLTLHDMHQFFTEYHTSGEKYKSVYFPARQEQIVPIVQ